MWDLLLILGLTILVIYGVFRYSKWLNRTKPNPPGGGGGPAVDDLPNHDPTTQK